MVEDNIKIKLENDKSKFLYGNVTFVMLRKEPRWQVKEANMMKTYAKAVLCLLGALHLEIPSSRAWQTAFWAQWTLCKTPVQRKRSSFMWEGEVNFNLMDQEVYMY